MPFTASPNRKAVSPLNHMNEWEFTAFPFSTAKYDQSGKRSQKTRDITLLDSNRVPEPSSNTFNAHAIQFKKGRTKVSLVQTKNPIQDNPIGSPGEVGVPRLARPFHLSPPNLCPGN
jgi:hypothetical protein